MNNKFLSKTTIASLAIITAVLCACTSENRYPKVKFYLQTPPYLSKTANITSLELEKMEEEVFKSSNQTIWKTGIITMKTLHTSYSNQGNKHSEIKDSGLPRFTKKMEFTIFLYSKRTSCCSKSRFSYRTLSPKYHPTYRR